MQILLPGRSAAARAAKRGGPVSAEQASSFNWNATPIAANGALALVNESTHASIAQRVELAISRAERRRGLLGRQRLEPGAALVLAPCFAVHTAGMQFPIDVVFVNKQGLAVRVVRGLAPWR